MRVKNIDTVNNIYQGQTLTPNQEYTLEASEVGKWATDDLVLSDISNSKLQIGNDSEWISGVANQINELTGQLPKDDSGKPIFSQTGIAEPNGHRARLKGICKDTINAGSTDYVLDYKMEQLQYQGVNKSSVFDGVEYYAKNADNFDEITFQVIDKDNILGYGAGFIVEQFGDKVFIMPDSHVLLRFYRSAIVPNLYLRAKYTSYGASDVKFSMNLIRHLVE
jgi:hypothetical protein